MTNYLFPSKRYHFLGVKLFVAGGMQALRRTEEGSKPGTVVAHLSLSQTRYHFWCTYCERVKLI